VDAAAIDLRNNLRFISVFLSWLLAAQLYSKSGPAGIPSLGSPARRLIREIPKTCTHPARIAPIALTDIKS
jgi:hypothetical protein